MPLKHSTETILIACLSLVTIVTGILTSALPSLPSGALPWLLLLGLTLAYPAALYPMLRRNRADYEFRLLHFAPAVILLVWLALSLLALRFHFASSLLRLFVFAGAFPAVVLILSLLALFSLYVLRRREIRLALITLFIVLSAAIGLALQQPQGSRLQALLWRGTWWNITGTGSLAASSGDRSSGSSASSVQILPPSSWREKPPLAFQSSSSRPSHLPSAGTGLDLLVLSVFSLYSATLHARARRRARKEMR